MPTPAALSPSAAPPLPAASSTQRLARARELDAEIRRLHRRRNVDQARIARRLAELHHSRGYLSLGFASVKAYAWDRIGWGAAKVKSLLELHGRLGEQPRIRAAFEAGEVDWSKAVLASRAARREPEREAELLQDAQRLSSRAFEAKLRGKTGERPRRRRAFDLEELEDAALEEGFRALRSEGLFLEPGAALAELVRRALRGGRVGSSSYRVLLGRCPDCERTVHYSGREELPVPASVAERLLCDAEVQDTCSEPARVTQTIPPSVKNAVLARSRGCCEFPRCTNRGYLDFHHMRGRGRGHDPDEILHLCGAHHQAPHEGALRIRGSWRTGVRFLLADGTLVGTVGGPGEEASRDAAGSAGEEEASRDAGSWTSVARPPRRSVGERLEEQALALRALKKLELPTRQAESLLRRVLDEQPILREAEAAELVRAVLVRC